MKDQLVGYMLGALEPSEHERVEKQLNLDENLRREMDLLGSSLDPLRCDSEQIEPPKGLAARCCQTVQAEQRKSPAMQKATATSAGMSASISPAGSGASGGSRWRKLDFAAAACIVLGLGLLVMPFVIESKTNAQSLACQDNLNKISSALQHYSSANDHSFPALTEVGNMSHAGVFAPMLVDGGFTQNGTSSIFTCPVSATSNEPSHRFPKLVELEKAKEGDELDALLAECGDYGYSLGYRENNRYYTTRNTARELFPVLSDAPSTPDFGQTGNHGGRGHNVLFEDGHVEERSDCAIADCGDNSYFLNRNGDVAAGLDKDDAVIGNQFAQPSPN